MTLTESYWPADADAEVLDFTTGDLLRHGARHVPHRLALVEVAPPGAPSLTGAERTDRTWTYAQLHETALRCANWLLRHFRPGDRITVWAPNVPEWLVLQYGAALAGLVLVTANPALRPAELRYVLTQSGSAGLFHVDTFRGTAMAGTAAEMESTVDGLRVVSLTGWLKEVEELAASEADLPPVSPDDPVQIQYTSGTTGFPKGALLHHRGMVTNASFVARRAGFPEGGVWATGLPMFHTGGSGMSVLGCASAFGTFVLCQYFDPTLVLDALERYRADLFAGVPTMMLGVLEHPEFASRNLGSVKIVASGGASVPPALVRRAEEAFGARFFTVYGQTEVGAIATATKPEDSDEDKANTVGQPLWQIEVSIVDPTTGARVPVGEQGEIWLRGYQRMLAYYDLPEETAATIRPDGWLRTGDIGTMDSRGYVRITGRSKDMIIRGGENIYPREIEDLLVRHPAIADAVVVGLPDEQWGEVVAAVLRPAPGLPLPPVAELHQYCRDHLAPHKTPRSWHSTDAFPLTASGKIQKFRVVELLDSYTELA
ncbi:acyl-CoA synthetase (AMP-forming)/AMP-acid ligase II [Crossiella equi]|uniref:Acyl-CoA synthetase (AMP-forming)/AMP-acid ligase II n=1 Tax=Crossiella equi TaxID=130796 RepID=A0ABS5ARZ7_9PSEU|nr:AMP-binding protein [Crossiella equi]MBP2479362.1 acyl-CoA synthetase (AMP-forming)/AMP-acid ligase II [Crossiella equi]